MSERAAKIDAMISRLDDRRRVKYELYNAVTRAKQAFELACSAAEKAENDLRQMEQEIWTLVNGGTT